jgi:hypothetical protein
MDLITCRTDIIGWAYNSLSYNLYVLCTKYKHESVIYRLNLFISMAVCLFVCLISENRR